MEMNVNAVVPEKDFPIKGMSYIGAPRSNTAMFITKKVEHLLTALESVTECLVFAEEGIVVSEELSTKHAFCFSKKPQLAYARFANQFAEARLSEEKKLKFQWMPGGYYLCEDSTVGEDAYIEPGCVIGPDAKIGKRAKLLANCVVRRCTIGDDFVANEGSVIGANGFTMTADDEGNTIRIPTLGRVIIGNQVEIGTQNNVSCGSAGDTIIEDNVKTDSLIHIAHDNHLHKNVEVTAGVTFAGFVEAGEGAYLGVGSVLRNRITLGERSFVGMGSNVTRSVEAGTVVAGNPAKPFVKK